MTRQEVLYNKNEFSIYGIFRFTAYLFASIALYMGNLQIAAITLAIIAIANFVTKSYPNRLPQLSSIYPLQFLEF